MGVPRFAVFLFLLLRKGIVKSTYACVCKKQGNCKIHLSFYFWDMLLFWANTPQSWQGITLGRHNAVGPPPGITLSARPPA